MTYTAIEKPNQLIYGQGSVAIVVGWTVAKSIAKQLKETDFSAIGQLYSASRGLSFLIRNLLHNPQVRDIVILSATPYDKNAGGCQCLHDFFEAGFEQGIDDTGNKSWVVKSAIAGFIDFEISESALELLRKNVKPHFFEDRGEAIAHVKFLASGFAHATTGGVQSKAWGEPLIFPRKEIQPTILPGHRYAHRIEGRTIAETWVKLIHRIKTTGTIRPTGYDGKWQELIDLVAVVTDEPQDFYFPEPNYLPCDRTFLAEYIPQVVNDATYQEGVKYTYGQRLRSWFDRDQVEQVIQKLIAEIDAASAVMSLWDVKDHEKGGSPCLNHIWLRVVDNELSMTATFRSNDMFSAWPSNAMGLRALQQHIRDAIAERSDYNLTMGPLITVSQSAHIYDDCWAHADKLIEREYPQIVADELKQYQDPVGDFIIQICGNEILVERTFPSGSTVKVYSGKDPLKLARAIAADAPGIKPDHALYLGIELEKAKCAIEQGAEYRQDMEVA